MAAVSLDRRLSRFVGSFAGPAADFASITWVMATILVVDDEAAMRVMLTFALSADHTVLEASNGQEGLAMFAQHQPALIITDLHMPVMSGIAFVGQVRALSSTVKIIAHAAFHNPSERAAILQAGADLCLSKPANIIDLESAVATLLARSP